MSSTNDKLNWRKVFDTYNTIKYLYALCEETDPDLNTNLQPLNEFRAALDHVLRLIAIENFEEYRDKDPQAELDKLYGHLSRAFFDLCDMISINYRNKIIDSLEDYSVEDITVALPTYYSEIKPNINKFSENIARLRTNKRFESKNDLDYLDEYPKIIKQLQNYYETVLAAQPSLYELRQKREDKEKRENRSRILTGWVIPIVSIIVALIIALIGWLI
ncbi:MAG: hypothetical protein LUG52_02295 [Clostridia bacterium]|nr:hypothetical protein [Clostridia bacterium]